MGKGEEGKDKQKKGKERRYEDRRGKGEREVKYGKEGYRRKKGVKRIRAKKRFVWNNCRKAVHYKGYRQPLI